VLEQGGRVSEIIIAAAGIVGLLLFWTLVVTSIIAMVIAAMAFVPIAGRGPRPAREPIDTRARAGDRHVTDVPLSITDQMAWQERAEITFGKTSGENAHAREKRVG
jgi:hypothetical protein